MNPTSPSPSSPVQEMASRILQRRINEVRSGLIECRRNHFVAVAIAFAALVSGGLWLALAKGVDIAPATRGWIHLSLLAISLIAWWLGGRNVWSDLQIARRVETARPDLDMGLITAVEKLADEGQPPSYLTEKLFDQTVVQGTEFDWNTVTVQAARRKSAVWLGFVIALLLFVEGGLLRQMWPTKQESTVTSEDSAIDSTATPGAPWTVEVSPGDTEVEKGSRVVFEASFSGALPAGATLVTIPSGGQESQSLPMQSAIEEGVFGAVMNDVSEGLTYRIDASGHSSEEYRLDVFEFPALIQSDLVITPPAYTGDEPREIKKATKATVLQGSSIEVRLEVNKPLAAAELFGEDESIVPLETDPDDPTLLLATLAPSESIRYRVHLVDEADRANRNPPWLTFKVRENQLPKIDVVFPKRDIQVSPIQELPLEAKVSDDLGVTQSGLVYTLGGTTEEVSFKLAQATSSKPTNVRTILRLEDHAAEPRQLLSYYFWAEDEGPQGESRRAMSDMFFAEVRHFEDIFREAEAPPSEPGEPKPQSDELVEIQKEVTNATWRIIRDISAGKKVEDAKPDIGVVSESQGIALDMVKEAMEKAEDPELSEALAQAWKSMRDAIDPLEQARDEAKRSPLNQALGFEQSALEWLQRAQSREHQVAKQNQPPKGGAGSQKQKEELAALELKQDDQRYEEERSASPEASAEQQENLQVLARLKELARRQEALAKKMQELQDKLENAKDAEEKKELANQLKQLQQEQEELLKDLDDLGQKMDEATDPTKMADARDQLEQTRDQALNAAEQLEEQKLTEASQSATRAQRQLEQMEEEFRKRTSSEFANEAKQLRQEARQLAEAQEQIHQVLEDRPAPKDGPFDDPAEALKQKLEGAELARELEAQADKLEELLNATRTLSEQAEVSEPILSRKLYEAVREAQTQGLEDNLNEARFQTKYGARKEALESERKAAQAMEQLSEDIAEAAETVLGSETEALRMARTELDRLIEQAEQELAQISDADGDDAPRQTDGKDPSPSGDASAAGQQPLAQETASTAPTGNGSPSDKPDAEGEAKGAATQKGSKANPDLKQDLAAAGKGKSEASAAEPGPESSGQGEGESPNPSESPSQASASGQSTPSESSSSSPATQPQSGNRRGQDRGSSGGSGSGRVAELFFDSPAEQPSPTPITGEGYNQWADGLRTVEELLNEPELRNDASKILDDARGMRVEANRNNAPPQVDHLESKITRPLVELRNRVIEELARLKADDPTVPIDRDPVPPEYQDLVRRYYTELGRGK